MKLRIKTLVICTLDTIWAIGASAVAGCLPTQLHNSPTAYLYPIGCVSGK